MTGRGRTELLLPGGGIDGEVRRTVLPGGLRVITEHVPAARSVAVGVWVDVGSLDETPALAGASHYLEHLLFKGTHRRSAAELSGAVEEVGGDLNAFTTHEHTCFYARVLAGDLKVALEVIADMVTDSLLAAGEVENERSVVLEEIALHEDDPGDGVHDAFAGAVFTTTPLGRPVLGSVASVSALSRPVLQRFYRRHYRPERTVVTLSGAVDHAAALRLVRRSFAAWLPGPAGGAAPTAALPLPARRASRGAGPVSPGASAVWVRPTEQAHLVLGGVGLGRHDERRWAFEVLLAAVGGGMSSRLFQQIRERRGLVYSIYTFASSYAETGLWGVYAGCKPRRAKQVLALVGAELRQVAREGLEPAEVARGQAQLRGSLLLGLEDLGTRMDRLGKAELGYGELLAAEDLVRRIEAVSAADVAAVAAELLGGPWALGAVAPAVAGDLAGAVA